MMSSDVIQLVRLIYGIAVANSNRLSAKLVIKQGELGDANAVDVDWSMLPMIVSLARCTHRCHMACHTPPFRVRLVTNAIFQCFGVFLLESPLVSATGTASHRANLAQLPPCWTLRPFHLYLITW